MEIPVESPIEMLLIPLLDMKCISTYLNHHRSARWRTVDEQNDAGSKESLAEYTVAVQKPSPRCKSWHLSSRVCRMDASARVSFGHAANCLMNWRGSDMI